MIKTKMGKVKFKGDVSVLYADVAVIINSVLYNAVKYEFDDLEDAKNYIRTAVEDGLKTMEEIVEESIEEHFARTHEVIKKMKEREESDNE